VEGKLTEMDREPQDVQVVLQGMGLKMFKSFFKAWVAIFLIDENGLIQ